MPATEAQIRDLANTIALQSDALAQGKIDPSALYATVRKISENARTLEVWTSHLKPEPVSQNRVIAVEAVNAVEASGVLDSTPVSGLAVVQAARDAYADPGYCSGCGKTYRSAAGLRAHQSRPFISLACKGLTTS